MNETTRYENFPAWIVLLCNVVALSIYAAGAYILAGFGVWASILYLLYCLWLEVRVLRASCANCYYYDKVCGTGKGKVCALLFKRGDPRRFAEKQVSWRDVLPDFLVSILPLVGGVILLVRGFAWPRLVAMVLLVALSFGGNAVVRGSLLCKYCRQREIGCPAARLFAQGQAHPPTDGESG